MGKFLVPTLHAIANGALGEFSKANVVVAAGKTVEVGDRRGGLEVAVNDKPPVPRVRSSTPA